MYIDCQIFQQSKPQALYFTDIQTWFDKKQDKLRSGKGKGKLKGN